MKPISRTSLFLIYVTVFINIVAFSMVFPLLPLYAKLYNASDISIGLLAASFAAAQFLFSPIWGMLSDKFGRKPIILVGLLGSAASFLVFGFAENLTMLFISRFFQGVFSAASIPAARAYIADITTKKERVREMGRIGASLALGVILGPAIGGLLAGTSHSLPFFGAAAVAGVAFLFVFKFLPESLQSKNNASIAFKKGIFASASGIQTGLQSSLMRLFLLSFFWSFLMSNNAVAVPLLSIEVFRAQATDVGMLFVVMGVVAAIVQFFLISKIAALFGDRTVIIGGLTLMALGFMIMPFLPPTLILLYVAVAIAALGSATARPVITALISKETKEGQGATMGTANAFESLGRLIGPILGGILFAFHVSIPFLFSGAVVLLALVFLVTTTNFLKQKKAPLAV